MAALMLGHANEFIEKQLNKKLVKIGEHCSADVMSFSGPIQWGCDDQVRIAIERKELKNKRGKKLVIMLTTVGGYIEVVQRIVDIIRKYYDIIDFIIPNYAYSAGTVLAMSGDAIYMDYYGRLGPIDPQIENRNGNNVPALGYLEQYSRLIKKADEGKINGGEIQILLNFDQAELYKYEQARELSISLLKEWLVNYKFRNWKKTEDRKKLVTKAMRTSRAGQIAKILNDTKKWHIHGFGISMDVLRKDLKLKIDDFAGDIEFDRKIREYCNLLDDYMMKIKCKGLLHMDEIYQPLP